MRAGMLRLLVTSFLVLSASAQTLSIRHAALPGLTSGFSVAPGSMVVAVPLLLPNSSASIRLQMQPRGSALILEMPVVAVNSSGIWALVPDNAPLGRVDATLTVNGASQSGSFFISRSSIGIFSASPYGAGIAVAQNIGSGGRPTLNHRDFLCPGTRKFKHFLSVGLHEHYPGGLIPAKAAREIRISAA